MTKFVLTGVDPHALRLLACRLTPATVYGELFNRENCLEMEKHDKEGVLIKIGQDPIEFLEHQVYTPRDTPVGFLLPVDQARCTAWSRVWGYLRKNTTIVLVKRNPVQSYLHRYNGWIYIDPNILRDHIDNQEQLHKDLLKYFFGSSLLEISSEYFDKQTARSLGDLLGLEKLEPDREQESICFEERVENWRELFAAFRGTRYFDYLVTR